VQTRDRDKKPSTGKPQAQAMLHEYGDFKFKGQSSGSWIERIFSVSACGIIGSSSCPRQMLSTCAEVTVPGTPSCSTRIVTRSSRAKPR
jgi:hypothetical protein